MRLAFMGTPEFSVPCLETLAGSRHEMVVVVTQPDRPKGRSGEEQPSPVKATALHYGLEILQPEKIRKNEAFHQELEAFEPDVIVVVAYGLILPQSLLDLPAKGCINVHASLLPKYRGAAPINWAIVHGEAETGVTTMLMDAGMDTGPVLLQKAVAIEPRETAETLHDKLKTLGADLLLETLDLWERDRITPRAQDPALATLAPMLKREDGLLEFQRTAAELDRRIRGFTPWPGAYAFLGRLRVKFLEAWPSPEPAGSEPGTLIKDREDALWVATGEGLLKAIWVQPEGKAAMTGEAFLRGYRARGDVFG